MWKLTEDISSLVRDRPGGSVAVAVRLCGSLDGRVDIDSDRTYPAASVIKLRILLSVLTEAERGSIDLDAPHPIDRSQDAGGYGVLSALPSIHQLSPRELASLMITCSDNTATNALIDIIGLERAAETARTLGLQNCSLQRRMMDVEAAGRGKTNEISAADAASLIEMLVRPGPLSPASCRVAHGMLLRQHYRDRLPRRTDHRVDVANKTGDLPGVRHDVAVMRCGDAEAYVAVLTEGFPDPRTAECLDGGAATELIAALGETIAGYLVSRPS